MITLDAVRELEALGVDPCGELGEYHTLVTGTPLFNAPIGLVLGARELHSECWALDVTLVSVGGVRLQADHRSCCALKAFRSPTARTPPSPDGCNDRDCARVADRPSRTERLRQDDAPEAAVRRAAAAGRPRHARRPAAGCRCARRELARHIAVVPQETHPAFDYTRDGDGADGAPSAPRLVSARGPADLDDRARQSLEATGTAPLAERNYMTLSGGEKQRVVIASALAQATERPAARRADRVARSRLSARNRRAARAPQPRPQGDDGARHARSEPRCLACATGSCVHARRPGARRRAPRAMC